MWHTINMNVCVCSWFSSLEIWLAGIKCEEFSQPLSFISAVLLLCLDGGRHPRDESRLMVRSVIIKTKFICFGRSLSRPELGHENTHFLFLSGAFERGNQFAHSQACCLSLVPAKQSLHFQDHENPYVSEERCVMGMTAVMGAGVRIALAAQTHDRRPERKQKKEKSIRPARWHFVQCREKMLRQTDVCLWKQRHSEV